MIAEIKFKLEAKVSNLKAKNVKFYCECKCLKIDGESEEIDALIDLCPIHEEMYKKLEKGKISPEEAVIPQVRLDFSE